MALGHDDTLGKTLQGLRRRAGLTQQETAAAAGLSVAALRDVEQGRVVRPRPGTLRRLGLALGMDVGELARLARPERQPAAAVWIGVLGPLVVTVDGREVDLGSVTQRALLGLLALSPNVPVGRETLLEAAWDGSVPPARAGALPTRIYRLRRRLRPPGGSGSAPAVESTGSGYQLTASDDQLDLLAFRNHVQRGRSYRKQGELSAACDQYAAALRQWRGEPLVGLTGLAEHPMVVELTRAWQSAVLEYAAVATELERYEEVVPLLRRVTELAPLHEPAHARLMMALAGSGQQAAALTVFDAARRRLAEELGVPPGPELAGVHLRVLRHELPLANGTPVPAHRQLPPDIADFSGREAELRWLQERLPAGECHAGGAAVCVIEGMGGVGKTRLALHFAHQLLAAGCYADQQLYVDLCGYAGEPPARPEAVLASFLHLLGVPDGEIPDSLAERTALYQQLLRSGNALVLLDNAASAEQVGPLLPDGAASLALVTSRRALGLAGSDTLVLDVFSRPDAVAFLGRVAGTDRVDSAPAAAVEVVERCGRLPLAVALAGRRLQSRPSWTLADLASRLAVPHRLDALVAGTRSLCATFDLSYYVLPPNGRRVFQWLGKRPEGDFPTATGLEFTAATAAAATGLSVAAAQQALDNLVAEHLVTPCSGQWYRIHGLLRDYAARQAEGLDIGEAPH